LQGPAQLPRWLGQFAPLKPSVRGRSDGKVILSELIWRPPLVSKVFHGRDIMAPAAGRIARGEPISTFTQPIHDPVLLNVALAGHGRSGEIIHIDHFGNATSNIPQELLEREQPGQIVIKGQSIGPLRQKYADVAPGEPLALIGSSGLLEIAVRDGSAAGVLGLRIHDTIELH
jgi:S-adenosylmethionine hydrolase